MTYLKEQFAPRFAYFQLLLGSKDFLSFARLPPIHFRFQIARIPVKSPRVATLSPYADFNILWVSMALFLNLKQNVMRYSKS